MTLIAILIGTVAAGVGSVWLAAFLSFAMLARFTQHMLSLAAGALMATAFMHLLPEAFESAAGRTNCLPCCWGAWSSFSCWTRPNSGTTGTSTTSLWCRMTTRVCTTAMSMTTTTAMAITRMNGAPVGGPCWRVTACMPLVTAS
jgi:hypothetical protein